MDTAPATESAAIAVFGGSGATGKLLIAHALDRGLKVRALERTVGSISPVPERLEVLQGSLTNYEDVLATLEDCSAVICVFGPRPPFAEVFCETATATIVAAMKKFSICRLVCQTGGLIGEYPANRTLPFRLMADQSRRRWPQQNLDREGQERVVIHSGLAWTIVKPPRLTNGKPRGIWTVGPEVREGMLSSISREDLAEFLLAETLTPRHLNQAVFIRN